MVERLNDTPVPSHLFCCTQPPCDGSSRSWSCGARDAKLWPGSETGLSAQEIVMETRQVSAGSARDLRIVRETDSTLLQKLHSLARARVDAEGDGRNSSRNGDALLSRVACRNRRNAFQNKTERSLAS